MRVLGVFIAVCLFAVDTVAAQDVTVRAAVEKQEVYVGESFLFQITVDGDDSPTAPDMSEVKEFSVQELGGQASNSTSVTIINGRVTQNVIHRYVLSYRLTAKRVGTLTIPRFSVETKDGIVVTQPIRVFAKTPTETQDFKLRMSLSSRESYVGEPLTLNVVWYIGKNVEDFRFNLPLTADNRFLLAAMPQEIDSSRQDHYVRVELPFGEVYAEKTKRTFEGRKYLSLSFDLVLIPKEAGEFVLPQSTVSCSAVTGYQQRRRSADPFGSFFDDDFFFGGRRRAVVKQFVTPSNELSLKVRSVPSEGKPAGFGGLVGRYSISASASPRKVRVGDPITLTIRISGPDFLQHVPAPNLSSQPMLAANFKIPAEMADGVVQGGEKVFTQTLRAKQAEVSEIPPIELTYFDTSSGHYEVAHSQAIPIEVESARVVTAADVEGRRVQKETSGKTLETLDRGIRHNYEDDSVIETKELSSGSWFFSAIAVLLLAVPPGLFVLVWAMGFYLRQKGRDPEQVAAKKAYSVFEKSLSEVRMAASPEQALYDAFSAYLRSRLSLPSGVVSYSDVARVLNQKGISEADWEDVREVFEQCEASKFAGGAAVGISTEGLIDRAAGTIRKLERGLK